MPVAAIVLVCLLSGVSLGSVLLGGLQLLARTMLALPALIAGLALYFGAFRFALPYFAVGTRTRSEAFFKALGLASFAEFFGVLILLGIAKHANVEPDFILFPAGVGLFGGLLAGGYAAYLQHNQQRLIRSHQQGVQEAHRLLELDAPKDAEDKLKESLLQLEVALGSSSLHVAQACWDLARFYQETNKRPQAASLFRRALDIRENRLGDEDPRVSSTLMDWVSADDKLEAGNAVKFLHRALLVLEKQVGPYSLPAALAYERIGSLHLQQGQQAEAEAALRRAFSILKKVESNTGRDQFRLGLELVRCYLAMQKPKEAEEVLHSVADLQTAQPAELQLQGLLVKIELAQQRGDTAASSDRAWQALELLQQELGPAHAEFKSIWQGCLDRLTEPFGDPAALNIYTALFSGDSFTLKQAVQQHTEWLKKTDGLGWTFLQWACFFGQERIVEALLAAGASADGEGGEWPPLQIACRWAHRRLISSLVTKVSSVNQASPRGWRAVHRCAQNGDDRLLEVLTSKEELDVQPANERGDTPLLIACRRGCYRLVVTLVSRGSDVNKVSESSGRGPLHEAAYIGHRAIVECLLLNGAQPDIKDKAGLTPIELAAQAERENVVRYMQSHLKGLKS